MAQAVRLGLTKGSIAKAVAFFVLILFILLVIVIFLLPQMGLLGIESPRT